MPTIPTSGSACPISTRSAPGGTFSVDINLVGPDLDVLSDYTDRLIERLKKVKGLVDIDTTLSVRKPELQVVIDRDRAADLGISAEPVATTLSMLVGGEPVSTFKDHDEQYDVWLRAEGQQRMDKASIADLSIPTTDGRLIPLGSFTRSEERRGPSDIERLNRQRRTTVGGNLDGISTERPSPR